MKYLSLLLIVASFALVGCEQDDGPAEEAGEKIDEMATDVGNKVEDACEELKEKADAKDKDC